MMPGRQLVSMAVVRGSVRGGLLLQEWSEGVAGDAVREAGEILDVLAVEHRAARGEALEEEGAAPIARRVDPRREAGGAASDDDMSNDRARSTRMAPPAAPRYTCFNIVSASLTSNLPGASTLTAFTVPSSTSIE